ncbi:MAG: hypothetical protein HY903_25005 [Deltaproteobacteria bacterium]|nr:hypothetical protein [Deltaproteobacteria bacterium]
MATQKTVEWVIDHKFDRRKCRHTMGDVPMVLHCHHYTSNYLRLADDAKDMNGKAIMCKASEAAFLPVFKSYFAQHQIHDLAERVGLIEEYWRMSGMGLLQFERIGAMSAMVRMPRSHADEGWVKKWGKRKDPINFIGQGYLMAAMAAIFDESAGSFSVTETQSIVSGAEASLFTIVRS